MWMYRSVISNVPSVQPTLRINPLNHAVALYHTPFKNYFRRSGHRRGKRYIHGRDTKHLKSRLLHIKTIPNYIAIHAVTLYKIRISKRIKAPNGALYFYILFPILLLDPIFRLSPYGSTFYPE